MQPVPTDRETLRKPKSEFAWGLWKVENQTLKGKHYADLKFLRDVETRMINLCSETMNLEIIMDAELKDRRADTQILNKYVLQKCES